MGTFTTTADNPQPGLNTFSSGSGKVKLDSAVLSILQMAAAQSPYNVIAFSGVAGRDSGSTNHPTGHAIDIYLQDPATGELLTNYAGAGFGRTGTMAQNFPAYETFAQTARIIQQQQFPKLDNTFRWGGYMTPGNSNKAGPDLMHFDDNPAYAQPGGIGGAVGGSSWATGLNPKTASLYGIKSTGLDKNPTLVAQIKGGLIPPANIPGNDTISPKAPTVPPAVAYAPQPAQAPGVAAIDNAVPPTPGTLVTVPPQVPPAVTRPAGGMVDTPGVLVPAPGGAGSISGGGTAGGAQPVRGNVQVANEGPSFDPVGTGPSASELSQLVNGGVIRTVPQAGTVAMPPGVRPSSIPAFDGSSLLAATTRQPTGSNVRETHPTNALNVQSRPVGNDVRDSHGAPANVQQVAPVAAPVAAAPAAPAGPTYDPSVKALQSFLGIIADGLAGPQTIHAVEVFQNAHGLKVDGIVGPQTLAALNAAAGAAPVPQPAPAGAAAAAPSTNALAAKPATVQLASGTTANVGAASTGANGYNYVVNADGTVTNTDTGHTSGTPAATVQAVNPVTQNALNQAAAFAYSTNSGGNFGPGLRPY